MAGKSPLSRSRARISSTAGEVLGIETTNRLLEVPARALVLQTHELDELVVGHQALLDRDRPRTRVGLRVVHRHLDVHEPVARAAIPLDRAGAVGERSAVDVEP